MEIKDYKLIDKTFDENLIITKLNNIFIKLFSAVMMDRLDSVKHFISDTIYDDYSNIIKNNKDNDIRQMYDELNVKSTRLDYVEELENYYLLKVTLESRYMDYLVKFDNGEYISGNNIFRIQVNYLLTFAKKKNVLQQGIVRKCPNCGNSLDINNDGKCKYCRSYYNQEDYDWVLTKIEQKKCFKENGDTMTENLPTHEKDLK